jgi:hypothetical protein
LIDQYLSKDSAARPVAIIALLAAILAVLLGILAPQAGFNETIGGLETVSDRGDVTRPSAR